MHSAFNLLVFPNSMFTPLLLLCFFYVSKGYELSGEIALKNNHYYYYYYHSADLPSIFIKHFTNKVDKLRASIATEHVTSTLVTGTTATTFSSSNKVSQLTVKECILFSAPKSCELDPIPSKLLIECLDSNLPSLIDLFNSSLASGIFPQCFKSALITPILKKMRLDHNDLNNYRPVSNLCLIAKILEKMSYPKFLPTSTLTIFAINVNQHIVQVTALKQLFRKLLVICSFLLTKATYLY